MILMFHTLKNILENIVLYNIGVSKILLTTFAFLRQNNFQKDSANFWQCKLTFQNLNIFKGPFQNLSNKYGKN